MISWFEVGDLLKVAATEKFARSWAIVVDQEYRGINRYVRVIFHDGSDMWHMEDSFIKNYFKLVSRIPYGKV